MATRGIYAAVITPTDEKGAISLERYVKHARWLLGQGCHGLGVFGTTSETQAFSVAERQEALEQMVAAGLPPEKMIVGVGCCARADTVALGRHAMGLGVTKLIMLPPFFYKNNPDEGLIRAYGEAIEGIGDDRLELFLYHFPQMSGVPVTPGVIAGIIERFPGVLQGFKDSTGDWAHTKSIIEAFPGISVFSGADGHLLDNLKAGGAGTFSAAANLNGAANREVFDAFEAGDMAAAEAGMAPVKAVREALQKVPLIPGVKYVVATGRKDPLWARVRPPMVELDEEQGKALLAQLEAIGYDYDPELYSVAGA